MKKLSLELQELMHEKGCKEFMESLITALHMASDDTLDFEDKSLTQRYRYYANSIQKSVDEEPEFSSNRIEE